MDQVKQAFSIELADSLKCAYGGRLPSLATIARDFSLKSPHLPHISTETIRKWIRGEALPHVSRMQVLIEWLGPQIADPFDKTILAVRHGRNGHATNGYLDHTVKPIHNELVEILEQLNEKECQSILAIAKLLAEKHAIEEANLVVTHNGHDRTEI